MSFLFFWIIFWIIFTIVLLVILIYLLLPWLFKLFVSPLFNASYVYNSKDFSNEEEEYAIPEQINRPKFIIDEQNGSYSISFGKRRAFIAGIIKIRHNGKEYSNINGLDKSMNFLQLETITKNQVEDKLGTSEQTTLSYFLQDIDKKIQVSFSNYIHHNFIVFTLTLPDGLEKTATGKYERLITGFPSFYNRSPNTNVF
ncbi:MAG: hypothetical protein EU550_03815, partial [Promethearchaeota archaeon]